MKKLFFSIDSSLNEISTDDLEEIKLKDYMDMVPTVKASIYHIDQGNRHFFEKYTGEIDAKKIIFINGISSPATEEQAEAVTRKIGKNMQIIPRKKFPKNSADFISIIL